MSYTFTNKGIDIDKSIYYFKHNKKNIDLIPEINNIKANIESRISNENMNIQNANQTLSNNYNEAINRLENRELEEDEIFELIYPIGSIYSSIDGTNPNQLFSNSTWEELTFNLSDNQIINAYYNTNDIEVTTATDGSKWYKIYSHDSNAGTTVFSSYENALKCRENDKFSDLWLLLINTWPFLNENNEFEFILQYYDKSTDYNRWTQTSNPFYYTQNAVEGYSPIHVDWTLNFGGLSRHNAAINSLTNCLLKGQSGTGWYYAIAPYENYKGGVPGPFIGSTATIITSRTYLWIRIPKLENNNLVSQKLNIKYYKRIS